MYIYAAASSQTESHYNKLFSDSKNPIGFHYSERSMQFSYFSPLSSEQRIQQGYSSLFTFSLRILQNFQAKFKSPPFPLKNSTSQPYQPNLCWTSRWLALENTDHNLKSNCWSTIVKLTPIMTNWQPKRIISNPRSNIFPKNCFSSI